MYKHSIMYGVSLIITDSMCVACSEDLQQHIVWQSIYKEANTDEIAVSLYVCEGTIRTMVGQFLAMEDVASRVN